jgi:hypothetical protein
MATESGKNSVVVVLKARAVAWLNAIEKEICTREVFASLAWLAVGLALASIFGSSRWAVASIALSLAVLSRLGVAAVLNWAMIADAFLAIHQTYRGEVANGEKEKAEATRIQHASVKIH